MSAFTILSNVFLFGLILLSIVIAVRSYYLPATVRNKNLGWLALGCYFVVVVAAFLVWGRDEEGIGITSIILGMPWSFIGVAILSPFTASYPHIISPQWQLFVQCLLFATILLNFRVAYMLGARLPALWTPPFKPSP